MRFLDRVTKLRIKFCASERPSESYFKLTFEFLLWIRDDFRGGMNVTREADLMVGSGFPFRKVTGMVYKPADAAFFRLFKSILDSVTLAFCLYRLSKEIGSSFSASTALREEGLTELYSLLLKS